MKLIKEPDKNQWNNIVFHYRRSNKTCMVGYIRTLSCCYWSCWQQHTQAPLPCRPVSDVQGCCQCGTNEVELPTRLEQHTGWVQLSTAQGTCIPKPWYSWHLTLHWQRVHSVPCFIQEDPVKRTTFISSRQVLVMSLRTVSAWQGSVTQREQHSLSGRTLNSHSTSGQGRGQQSTSPCCKGMDQREERQKRKDRAVIFILRSSKPTAKREKLHFL